MTDLDRPHRALLLTADMGAGHRQVADELARRLDQAGMRCDVLDLVRAGGRAGRRLQRTYRMLLSRAPLVYDAAMRAWAAWPAPLETFTAANARPFERVLADAVAATEPDVIVSTYNLASQCLGRLVERAAVRCPCVTTVIDPGPHRYWTHRRIERHLVPTRLTARRLVEFGAPGVSVVAPVVRAAFRDPPQRAVARERLGLPADARVALVNAGSWAAGDVTRMIADLGTQPDLVRVVLCGRDERLHHRLAGLPGIRAVPWTDAVADHLAAADVLVDNAGGVTCWEAVACGTPVVVYRPLPGHGRLNAAALDATGIARWARDEPTLQRMVADAQPGDPGEVFAAPDPAQLIVAAAASGRSGV